MRLNTDDTETVVLLPDGGGDSGDFKTLAPSASTGTADMRCGCAKFPLCDPMATVILLGCIMLYYVYCVTFKNMRINTI